MNAMLQIFVCLVVFLKHLFYTNGIGEFIQKSIVSGSGRPPPLLLPETAAVLLVVLPASSNPW